MNISSTLPQILPNAQNIDFISFILVDDRAAAIEGLKKILAEGATIFTNSIQKLLF